MTDFLSTLLTQLGAVLPLFTLIFLGYFLIKFAKWPKSMTDGMSRFVFSVAIPILLFRMMSRFSEQKDVDYHLLFAFFGSCFIVFIIGRLVAKYHYKLDGVSGSVFAIAGIFSNNLYVGLPMAIIIIGEIAVPSVALVLVFNALILWTMVTISIEFAKMGKCSLSGLKNVFISVIKNPIIIGIFAGLAFNYSTLSLPNFIAQPADMISQIASPLSLIVIGMGLAEYNIHNQLNITFGICFIKLILQPIITWLLAITLNIPLLETQVIVLLSSMSLGVNVYLIAQKFDSLVGPAASSLVISTILSAFTTPLILTFIAHF